MQKAGMRRRYELLDFLELELLYNDIVSLNCIKNKWLLLCVRVYVVFIPGAAGDIH